MRTRRHRLLQSWLALALTALLVAPPVWAGPKGERVVGGKAGVTRKGNRTKIKASDHAIIEWDSFDIGKNEKVRFAQPGKKSRVLNRVMTGNASQIDGKLKANGQVYIVNPDGVFFGGKAVVDVSRLVAVGGSLSNDDFLAGVDRFDELHGSVVNHGLLSGKDIALVGRRVANHGRIESPDGGILMVAGDEVWLAEHDSHILVRLEGSPSEGDDPSVWNTGVIDAGSGRARLAAGDAMGIAIHSQGEIRARRIALEASGEGARVDVAGKLDAADLRSNGKGGRIDVSGDWVSLHDLEIDASGREGGGKVRLGGDVSGDESEVPRALGTYLASDVTVRADATREGNGGSIVVWGDRVARVFGDLSARGGADGGDGGFVETSGLEALDIGGAPDLSAAHGDGGQWLIDPVNIEIISGTGSLDDASSATPNLVGDAALFQSDRGNASVGNQVIVDALSSGTDVVVTTERFGSEGNKVGDITINAPIQITDAETTGEVSLTFKAANDIIVNAPIAGDAASLGINLQLLANNNPLMAFVDSLPPPGSIRSDGIFQPELGQSDDVDDNPQFERGDVIIDASLDTAGGALLLQGVNVEVNQAITTTGGVAVLVGTNPRVGEDRVREGVDGDVILNAGVDARSSDLIAPGGSISVIAGGTAQLASGAELVTNGAASVGFDGVVTDVQGTVGAESGLVTLGRGAGSIGNIELFRTETLTLAGGVATADGAFFGQGDAIEVSGSGIVTTSGGATEGDDIELIGHAIDIGGPLDAGQDDVSISARNGVVIRAFTVLAGSELSIESGTNPTDDDKDLEIGLDLEADVELQGDEILLTAGDGVGGRDTAAIDLSQAILRSNSDPGMAPDVIDVIQDAALSSSILPTIDRIGGGDLTGLEYTVRSATGGVTVEALDGGKFDGADLTLDAQSAIDLQNVAAITPEDLTLRSAQGITLSEVDFDPGNNDTGVLRVDRALPGTELLIISGTDGEGDITFNGDVTLLASDLRLRAGDGATGENDARVRLSEAAGTIQFGDAGTPVEDFVLRQDASITDADIPDATLFDAGIADVGLTIRSDAGSVTLDDATKVEDSNVTILSSGSLSLPDAINVRSAQLGKVGNFAVDQDLIDRINYSGGDRSLTLRAAVGGAGTLSFDDGVVLSGDEIRLVAGNNGSSGSGIVDVRNEGASPQFQIADVADPPAEFQFLVRQDSPITNSTLPKTGQFASGLPDVYALRSDEAGIALTSLANIPESGNVILDGDFVSIRSDIGETIDLGGARNFEFRTNQVTLESFVGQDADPGDFKAARIVASDADLVLADFDKDSESYDFDARSGVPDQITIRQEARVEAGDLPGATAYGNGSLAGDVDEDDATVFTIASRQGSIDLTGLDPDQLNGSNLTLRVTPFSSDNRNAKNVDSRTVNFDGANLDLEVLLVETPGALTLDDDTEVTAQETLSLLAGTAGQGGDLDFGTNVVLGAQTIGFVAGDGSIVNRGRPRSQVNAAEPSLQLDFVVANETVPTGLILQQDKSLSQDNLPASSQFSVDEGAGPVAGVENLDAYVVESREGSISLDRFEDVNARSVAVISSSLIRDNATVRISDPDGDLDFVQLLENGQEERDITLAARQIVLRSDGADGKVLANDARLLINGASGEGSSPFKVRIKQRSDLGPENGVSPLPGLNQFGSPPFFSTYQLVSTEGDVLVGSSMARDLEFSNLRLIAADTVTINVDRSDDFDEDDPNRPTTNLDLASIEARAPEIVLDTPVIEDGSGSIRTFGQQIFDADQITIAEDTSLEGRSIDFQGPIDALQEGGQSLEIFSFGSVGIREDVGLNAALHDLEVIYDLTPQFRNTTQFGRLADDSPLVVQVTDDLRLNAGGRKRASRYASFFKANGDLTLRSLGSGTIDLGEGEALTVLGDLTVESLGKGGSVRVSDLNARDTLRVEAHRIELVRRNDGRVWRRDDALVKDGGVDYNANEIIFEFDELGVAGPNKKLPVFGVPDANDPPDFLVDPPKGQRFALASLSPDRDPLTSGDFFRGDRVLDFRPAGPSRSDLTSALPGPLPRPGRARPVESGVPPRQELLEVGVEVRPETQKEHRHWLDGAAVYDDSGATRRIARVASRRIEADAMARSVDLFERLFGPDRANAPRIQDALQGAVDRYLESTKTQHIVGFEFRRFVKNRPSSLFEAYQALEDLDSLLRAHRNSGLTPAEYRRIQTGWLEDIRPEGIEPDELAESIHPSRYVRGSDILDIFGQ